MVADAAAPSVDAAAQVACIPRGPIGAVAAEKHLEICSEAACIDVDPATGIAQPAARVKIAEPLLAAATVAPQDKRLVACFKDKCRDIGKNARDVINRDPDVHNDHMAATTDLRGLVIPKVSPQLWDISGDREIHLLAPGSQTEMNDMRPVGDRIYAVWLPDGEAMYTRGGALIAKLSTDGTKFVMLDDTRSVALTHDYRVFIFGDELHTINLAESIGYTDWLAPTALAVLPDQTVAVVLSREGGEASVVLIDPQRGTVFRRWPLPLCPG